MTWARAATFFEIYIDRGQGVPPAEKLILPEDIGVVIFKRPRRPRSYVEKLILPTDSVFVHFSI